MRRQFSGHEECLNSLWQMLLYKYFSGCSWYLQLKWSMPKNLQLPLAQWGHTFGRRGMGVAVEHSENRQEE